MEPADNRQLPSRLRAPGSGQACRKTLGFALIPNCELKFGPVHNAPRTWLHKGVRADTARPRPPAAQRAPQQMKRPVSGGGPGFGPPLASLPASRAPGPSPRAVALVAAGPLRPAGPSLAGTSDEIY